MFIIRAHHLLCVLGFKGYGYSEDFIDNFTKIHKEVKKKSTIIKIVCEKDDVCKCCPKLRTDCLEGINPENIDKAVLSKLKIAAGSIYKSETIYRKLTDCIKVDDLDVICASCPWLEKGWCKQGLKKLKDKLAV